MGKRIAIFAFAAALMLLFGCITSQPKESVLPPIGPARISGQGQMPGGDRDSHGCIPSAGYSWCEEKGKCIRSWEENCTDETIKQIVGNDRDSHGCIGSAGYVWCEEKQKCLRIWEENCSTFDPMPMPGSDRDSHGCIGSAGYAWCPEKEKCLRIWEEDCPSVTSAALEEYAKAFCNQPNVANVYVCGEYVRVASSLLGGGSKFYRLGYYGDPISCPVVSPDSMSEECRLLMLGNNCVENKVDCSTGFVPAAITDLKDDPSFVGAQLTWSKPDENAVNYAVYRTDANLDLAALSLMTTTGQTRFDDVFDGGNNTFAYFVRARNADGAESAISNIVYVKQLSTATQPSPGQIN